MTLSGGLRRQITKAIYGLSVEQLQAVADYIATLTRPTAHQGIQKAEEEFKANKGIDWRKVRDDV